MADAGRQVRGPGVARLRERCRVHVIAGWGFYALDAATGRVLWSWRNARVLGASPAVIAGASPGGSPPATSGSGSPASPTGSHGATPTTAATTPGPINTRFPGLTTFRGNATRDYYGEGPMPSHPKILWRYPTSGGLCSSSSDIHGTRTWCGTGGTGQPNV